jgi:hypothetical protein
MRCDLSGPLAAALLLAVASGPCPAGWLDDATHNVGVEAILAPRGTIDSGETVAPRCIVANYGDSTESLRAFMAIDAGGSTVYRDSMWLPALAPAARETVTFAPWTPAGRDSMTALAWTKCASDTFPQDDTARVRFLVLVQSVEVSGLWPDGDILDSGAVISPRCRIWNYSSRWYNFDVRFRIFRLDTIQHLPVYTSVRNINLIPGGSTLVTAPDPWTTMRGQWLLTVDAIVSQGRIVGSASATFWVRGTIGGDIEASEVLVPPPVIETSLMFSPKGRVKNNGVMATFRTYFVIFDSSGTRIYADSNTVILGNGDSMDVTYSSTWIATVGNYVAAESVNDINPYPPNNCHRHTFSAVAHLSGDIGIVFMVMPCDTVDTLTTLDPTVTAKNYGPEPCSTYLYLLFADTSLDRTVYAESVCLRLAPGVESTAVFPAVRFTVLGKHEGRCWVTAGDTIEWPFWVLPSVGVEEGLKPQASSAKPQPTVLRRLPAGAVAFDAMGRRLVNAKPGVYFVREQSAFSSQHSGTENGARSTVHVHKVILQR